MVGEPLDRQPAFQVLHQQPERLRVLEVAQHVHLVLRVFRMGVEQARELRAPRVPIRLGEQHPCVEKLVEQQRMARQVVRCPSRRAHQVREARQQRRMLDHEGQVRAAARDRLQQREEALEDQLRTGQPGILGGHREQLRHQRVDALPRDGGQLLVARRPAHPREGRDERLGIGEAARAQAFPRIGGAARDPPIA